MLLHVKSSKFIRSFTVMLTGNILAQGITFLAALIITRLYTPADFGVMTFIWSLTMIISVGVSLGYQAAIVLPDDDQKGHLLFIFALACVLGVSVLTGVLCWLGVDLFSAWFGSSHIKQYLWFVPVGLLIIGMKENFATFYTRFRFFKLVALSRVMVSVFTAVAKIIPGILFGGAAIWLVAGNIAGPFIALLFLFVGYFLFFEKKKGWEVTFPLLIDAGREYVKFPKYNFPTQIVNSFSQNLPVLLFTMFYSPEVIGWYGLANTILRRPVGLIAQSLNSVFLQKSAVTENAGKSHFVNLFKATLGLITVGIIPLLVLLFWAGNIFGILFGNNWYEAGVYAQILSPWLFLIFISIPADQIIFVKQLLRFKLILEVAYLIAISVAVSAGDYFFGKDIIVTLLAFSAIGCLRGFVVLIVAFKYSAQNKRYQT